MLSLIVGGDGFFIDFVFASPFEPAVPEAAKLGFCFQVMSFVGEFFESVSEPFFFAGAILQIEFDEILEIVVEFLVTPTNVVEFF